MVVTLVAREGRTGSRTWAAKCKCFAPNATGFASNNMEVTPEVKRVKVELDWLFAPVSPVLKCDR